MTTASRQFTLRGLLVFTGIIGLGCGLAMAGDTTTVKGIVMLGVAWRILAIASLSAVIGFAIGGIAKVAIAVTTGVLLVDLGLLALYLHCTHPRSLVYVKDFLALWCINPLAVLALITYPGVAVKNRKLALTLGMSFSVAVPSILAGWFVTMYFYYSPTIDLEDARLQLGFLVITAFILGFLGVLGTLVVRAVVEKWEKVSCRKVPATSVGKSDEG